MEQDGRNGGMDSGLQQRAAKRQRERVKIDAGKDVIELKICDSRSK